MYSDLVISQITALALVKVHLFGACLSTSPTTPREEETLSSVRADKRHSTRTADLRLQATLETSKTLPKPTTTYEPDRNTHQGSASI